jgi:hypothetical protein
MTNAQSKNINEENIKEAARWVSYWIKQGKERGYDDKKTREWVSHCINIFYITDKYLEQKGGGAAAACAGAGVFKKPVCEGGKSGCGSVFTFFLGPEQFPQGYCAGCCEEAASAGWAEDDYTVLYDGKNLHPDIIKHAADLHEDAVAEIGAKKGYSSPAA